MVDASEPDPGPAEPLISIVVPVYNGARHLPAFFDGIEAQVRHDMELVLVDDGSEDDTGSLLAAFVSRTAWRCRVVPLGRNRGLGAARRAGFEAGVGAQVMCLDVDDSLEAGALDAVADAMADARPDGQGDTVLVFDYAVRIGERRAPTAGMVADSHREPAAAVAALLRGDISPYMWNKVIPRQGVAATDFSARRLGEDLPTLVRVFQVHLCVRRVPVPLLDYVVADGSLSQTGDLVGYTSVTTGQVAEVRDLLAEPAVWAACAPAFERWFAPRVLGKAALAAARRPDGRFPEVRRNVLDQTTLGQSLAGIGSGDRTWSALLVLLRVAPPLFRAVARLSARGRARS